MPVNTDQEFRGSLKVYDIVGKEVATLYEGEFRRGATRFYVEAARLPSGAYIVVLDGDGGRQAKKFMVK